MGFIGKILHWQIIRYYHKSSTKKVIKGFFVFIILLHQNVFDMNALAPCSCQSLFDTHMFLKVESDARILPPTKVEYKRSVGADILILVSFGDSGCFLISLSNRSPKPGNNVEPPDKIICEKNVRRKSMSVRMIDFTKQS